MLDEERVKGLLNRFVDASRDKRASDAVPASIGKMTENLLQHWKVSTYASKTDNIKHTTVLSFPDPEMYKRLDRSKRERMADLVAELGRKRRLSHNVVMSSSDGSLHAMSLRDAIFLFLSKLTSSSPTVPVTEDHLENTESEQKQSSMRLSFLEQLYRGSSDEMDEPDSWISHRGRLINTSIANVINLFDFTPKHEESVDTYNRPLRLWDFITKNGVISSVPATSDVDDELCWNSRQLQKADFEMAPEMNPLLLGSYGICNRGRVKTISDSCENANPGRISLTSIQQTVQATTKEDFERELIPTVLLALDGLIPAIECLETASTFREAMALNKLLNKITKSGRIRASLDEFISRPGRYDSIQHAFLSAIQSILRYHSAALQNLPEAICRRQAQEAIHGAKNELNITLIEAVLHTDQIQRQLRSLASICGLHASEGLTTAEDAMERFPTGIQLLSRLFRDLLEADNQSGNMTRFLFCCCFRPFHAQLRKWLYTTEDVFAEDISCGGLISLPDFLKSVEEIVFETGKQIRVLNQLQTELKTEEAIVHSIKAIAEAEAFEVLTICHYLDDPWALTHSGFHQVDLVRRSVLSDTSLPLPFQHNVVHEVVDVLAAADAERRREVQRLLKTAADVRKIEHQITDARALDRFLERMAAIERDRQTALSEVHDRMEHKQALLLEQREAVNAQHAKSIKEKTDEIRQERELLMDDALKEREEAMKMLDQEIRKGACRNDADDTTMDVDKDEQSERSLQSAGSLMAVDHESETERQSCSNEKRERSKWTAPESPQHSHDATIDEDDKEMDCSEESRSIDNTIAFEQRMNKKGHVRARSENSSVVNYEVQKHVDDSLVPIAAVIDGCVIQPILMQHKCISYAFSEMFFQELGFMKVMRDLKRLCFAESADWISNFVEKLFEAVVDRVKLTRRQLLSIYETSILESVYSTLSEPLRVTLLPEMIVQKEDEDGLHDISSQQFVNQLNFKIELKWPLSLVITKTSVEEYNAVLGALLRVRQVRWWLDHVWPRFNQTKLLPKLTKDENIRLKTVRLWYQKSLSIVTMLMNYMHYELNHNRWEWFTSAMSQPSLSLAKIQDLHQDYLNVALETCFQRPNTRRLRSMLESALQTIINFCCILEETPSHPERHEPPLISLIKDNDVWDQLHRLSTELKHRLSAFYKTLKYRANRGECIEGLYVLMSYNSYYESMGSE